MGTRGRQLLYCSKFGAAQLPERYRRSQANNMTVDISTIVVTLCVVGARGDTPC